MIDLRCPACKQSIRLDESFDDRRLACIGCGKEFSVPDLKQQAAAKTGRPRSTDTNNSPLMSVVMLAKQETPVLDKARQHRDKIMAGLVVGMLGIAALVLYSSTRGGSDGEEDSLIASTNGANDPPIERRENPSDTGASDNGKDTPATGRYIEPRPTNGGSTLPHDDPGNMKIIPTPKQDEPSPLPKETNNLPKDDPTKPPQKNTPVLPPVSSATYASSQGILLRHSDELNDWITVSHKADIPAGSRIALPSQFTARLDVGRKLYAVRVVGGSMLQLLEPAEEAPFGLKLERGRLIVMGKRDSDVPGAVLTLAVRGERWRVELLSGNTVFGVEILPRRPQRFEQNFGEDNFTGGILVVKGSVRITDKEKRTREIAGNSWLSLAKRDRLGGNTPGNDQPPGRLPEPQFRAMPGWLDLDKLAAGAIENSDADLFADMFNRQQAFAEAIEPLLTSPDVDEVLMAVECQSLLGQRTNLVRALAKAKHAKVRRAASVGLREQMPTTKKDRDLLKKELAEAFGKGADVIYPLLWGYADEDIRKNRFTCDQLVYLMMHEKLVVRELVWEQITAHATARYAYKPEAALRFRRVTSKKWQQHVLKTGTILGDELR